MANAFKITIFCCSAEEDQKSMKRLKTYLRVLERQDLIEVLSAEDINPGDDWQREIEKRLDTARIILLLISQHFFVSDYWYDIATKRVMERHEKQEALVIPIILSSIPSWQATPFGKLQTIPPKKPITEYKKGQDKAFAKVAEHIDKVIRQLQRTAQQQREEIMKDTRNRVASLMELKHYDEALEAIERAIQRTFDNLDSWFYSQKGIIMRNNKQEEAALAAHDRAIEISPDDVGVLTEKAITLRVFKRYDEALSVHDEAIKKEPRSAWAHKEKAYTLRCCGQYEKAVEFYDKALRRENPQDARTITDKAIALRLHKQEEKALAAHQRASQLAPNDAWVQLEQAITLRDFKRYAEALIAHDKAIQLEPENIRHYVDKGITLRDARQYNDALDAFNEAIQRKKDSWAYGEMGITLRDSKQYKKALEAFEIAIGLNPNDSWLYTQKAITLRDFEDYEE